MTAMRPGSSQLGAQALRRAGAVCRLCASLPGVGLEGGVRAPGPAVHWRNVHAVRPAEGWGPVRQHCIGRQSGTRELWFSWTGSHRGFRTNLTCLALKSGIVGLPNVGKSTLFNAICENGKAQAANFPFCTIEPNVGIVTVPDTRLQVLTDISKSKSTVPTTVEFVDIAGLVKGASKGEGLGNQFLANIRECDALVQVVRCFENADVVHVAGKVDPVEDTDVINFELALADITQIEKRLERLAKGRAKTKEEAATQEAERSALGRIMEALEANRPARSVELNEDEAVAVRGLQLLTMKPLTYAANVGEDDLADQGASNHHVRALREKAAAEGCDVVVVSAQVEAELQELEDEEAADYLASLGASEGGLSSLIRATYRQLGLLTYFTTGEKETRAWTIRLGMTAPQAAGVIHTDFEKGFIRAETVAYQDFVEAGGYPEARQRGKLRLEGKEYVVSEADVLVRASPNWRYHMLGYDPCDVRQLFRFAN